MKKTLFLFMVAFTVYAKAQQLKSNEGSASFFSKAPLEDIDATSKHLASIVNISNNEIVFSVPINSFQFKNKKMQTDFNEDFMDTDKYPTATYKGKINEKIDWTKDGSYKITSTGKLTIHGVEKERTDTGSVIITKGQATIKSDFHVTVADHNVKIPILLFEKIAEEVLVKVIASYTIEKNPPEVFNND